MIVSVSMATNSPLLINSVHSDRRQVYTEPNADALVGGTVAEQYINRRVFYSLDQRPHAQGTSSLYLHGMHALLYNVSIYHRYL